MNEKKKQWATTLYLWRTIQEDRANANLSLWKRVEKLAEAVGKTPHGMRKFLIRNNEYNLIVTV